MKLDKFQENEVVIFEPPKHLAKDELVGGKCLVTISNSKAVYRVMNPTNMPVFLKSNSVVAVATEIVQSHIQKVSDYPLHTDMHAQTQNNNTQETAEPYAKVNTVLTDTHNTTNDKLGQQNTFTDEQYIEIAKEVGLNLDDTDLTEAQKQRLYVFLGQNRKTFAKDFSELGKTHLHAHRIETGNSRPVSKAPYRQSPDMRRETERQTQQMLDDGIIVESSSPYHSPIVLVRKRNNEWRFAVDYRELNKVTEPQSFPLPHIVDVFDAIADAKAEIFSVLDLKSGYWQVPLDPETAHKSAFITHQGVYQFTRLPFGLMNAPMTFQSLMTKVLRNLNWKVALVYIDDILVFSQNLDDHLNHLKLVFSNLSAANLTLQPSKCKFAVKEVDYLGHVISKQGIKVNPLKTHAVDSYPQPKTAKQIKSFLGMTSYYRRFIKDYSLITGPLTSLLKKDTKFKWTPECEKSFQTLKKALSSAPILAFPQFDKEFIISVDSSEYSIGFVLSQHDNEGREHPIAYGGRTLHNHELRWHITDKEGLALVEAVKQFRPYLANTKFTVYTDNISVKWLKQIKNCQGRLGRWALSLQGYNFSIVHKSGSANGNADGLSRRIYPSKEAVSTDSHDELADLGEEAVCSIQNSIEGIELTAVTLFYSHEEQVQTAKVFPATANTDGQPKTTILNEVVNDDRYKDLIKLQRNCEFYKDIVKYKLCKEVPDDPKKAKSVVAESYQFEIGPQGLLFHLYTPRTKGVPKEEKILLQLAVPKKMRDEILKSFHDSLAGGGHQGFERTYAALRLKYFWPSMWDDTRTYIQSCEPCQASKRHIHGKPPPLNPLPVSDLFGRWHIDILGGLPTTKDKYKYVLLVVDSYSKWCEAFPLRTQEATEVAAVLFKEIICRYGAPNVLVSDRGINFMSNLVKALCELFQITRYYTSSYRPLFNGAIERMNSVILQALRIYCKGQQDDWPDLLPSIMMAYRMTPATQSTQHSPFFLLYGREMRLPIDTALIPKPTLAQDFRRHLSKVLQNLEISRKIAADNIRKAQEKYKEQYDKRSGMPTFQPADRVWLYCSKVPVGKAPKLHRKWVGPYFISQTGPNHTFKLRKCSDNKEIKSMINATRLKPYYDPADRPTNPPAEWEDFEEDLNAEELPQEQVNVPNETLQQQPKIQNKGKQPVKGGSKAKNQIKRMQQDQNQTGNTHDQMPSTSVSGRSNERVNPGQFQNAQTNTHENRPSTSFQGRSNPDHSNQYQNSRLTLQAPSSFQGRKDIAEHSSQFQNISQDSNEINKPIKFDSTFGSTMHSADDIEKILSSKRANGKLYYYVQWKSKDKSNTWEFATSIPSVFVREFHVNRTMSGRKRKRKLQNHKFFDKPPTVQCLKPGQHRNQIIGVRESYHPYSEPHRYTIYDNIQGNSQTRMLTTEPDQTMKIWMRSYLDTLFNMYRENVHRNESHSKIGIQDNGEQFIGKMIRESHTCDPTDFENTTYFKVFSLGSKTPMWLPIQQVPPYCLRNFLFRIRNDFRLPSEF